MKRIISFVVIIAVAISLMVAHCVTAYAAEGADIVNCAMQYVGKVPYVWGGTNIDGATPGADCSGFICRIYEKFGINMWSNRAKLRNCGTNLGTDMNVAMLGDIIWYEGHVAIYAGRDSAGNHMVVHETGGSYQNVAYTKHAIVNAELKGIIRIPGVENNGQSVQIQKVLFKLPTQNEYVAKQYVSETNAVVVNEITKLPGVRVTKMGVYLYDANQNLIKKYTEDVSNVGANLSVYHSWYDINSELGIQLTKATDYYYSFFGEFDGQEIADTVKHKLTTGGVADKPQVTEKCKVTFYINYDLTQKKVVEVEKGTALGTLPTPIQLSAHTFDGYYTSSTGGKKVASTTIINGSVTLYPRYIEKDYGNNHTNNSTNDKETESSKENTKIKGEIELRINSATMYHNGKKKKIDENGTKPFIHNSRTFLPVRAVIEAMNGTVSWNEKSRTVSLKKDGKTLYLKVDFENAWDLNGDVFKLDAPPVIKNGRTMLPIRFIVEYFGGTVIWDADEQAITIEYYE